MPLPLITDVYRCFVMQHWGTIEIGNVLHVKCTAGTSSLAVAQDVGKAWGKSTSIASLQSSTVTFTQVEVTKLDGAHATAIDPFSTATLHTGVNGTVPFPPNLALCIGLRTAGIGRSARGRFYVGGTWPGQTADEVHWSSATLTSALAASIDFLGNLTSSATSPTLGVASYKHSSFLPLDHFVVNHNICTQRLRLA